ncbi:MAG TPA: ArsR family transcriptional regulator [Acidobacteria bacterium]|nr:ArsR family transcriptional regulator [Acidobacteriota bacterium]HAK53932.1 ArsR family transcriptional regulator [Acidobacteriota bacterium]
MLQIYIYLYRFIDVLKHLSSLYRLLGDDARLRLLRLLAVERLNVTELTEILGIAQSGVSRHLGLLKDAGLVTESRDGGYAYYRLSSDLETGGPLASLWSLLRGQFAEVATSGPARADDAQLREVLRIRRETIEGHGSADASEGRQFVPGRSWAAWARALGLLLPPLEVADLGCGEGFLTLEVARWARRVVAVDRSERVLQRARALARRRRVTNVSWKRGELDRLPLSDGAVDAAILSQALHHADDPGRAVAEAARIVRPTGRVLVVDLRAHDEQWVQERLGDRWLGFTDAKLAELMRGGGLTDVTVQVGAHLSGDPFTVLLASGVRAPAREARTPVRRRKATPAA